MMEGGEGLYIQGVLRLWDMYGMGLLVMVQYSVGEKGNGVEVGSF